MGRIDYLQLYKITIRRIDTMYNPYKTNYEEIKCDCGRIAVVLITPNGEKLPTYGVYSEEAKDMVYVPNGL